MMTNIQLHLLVESGTISNLSTLPPDYERRNALKWMGAGMALTLLTGDRNWSSERMVRTRSRLEHEIQETIEQEIQEASVPQEPSIPNYVLNAPVIVIDAGHGGDDPGTSGIYQERTYFEKDMTLDYAVILAKLLQEDGFNVVLTRNEDVTLSLKERSAHGKKEKTVSLSIHGDSTNFLAISCHFELNTLISISLSLYTKAILSELLPVAGNDIMSGHKEAVYTPFQLNPNDDGTGLHMTREPRAGIILELGNMKNPANISTLIDQKEGIIDALRKGMHEYAKMIYQLSFTPCSHVSK